MNKLKAMRSVYCYCFPEIWPLLREVSSKLTREMFLVTTPAEEVRELLSSLFNPPLEIPATPDGYIDLDEIHVPIIDRIVRGYSSTVLGIEGFKYSYPTPGSSEGIFKLLAKAKTEGVKTINVLVGEYEGYREYAGPNDLGMRITEIDPENTDVRKIQPGLWFISNPSARDGNIIPNSFIEELCSAGNRVVLDLSYVGATGPHIFDVSYPNISAIVMSLSKPYGLFRFRIGLTFSRDSIHSLYGNKWFKDTERLLQGLKVVEELGPDDQGFTRLYTKYKPVQWEIVAGLNGQFDLGMRTSDSLLLGYLTREDAARLDKEHLALITPFKRGNGYRFCLTPYFEEYERRGKK